MHKQCDQMVDFSVKYLVIYKKQKLPNRKFFAKLGLNFAKR